MILFYIKYIITDNLWRLLLLFLSGKKELKKQERSLICQIPTIFSDFESDLSCLLKTFWKIIIQNYIITFKNYFTLIKDLCAIFYTMNLSTRDGTGTLAKLGAFILRKVYITRKKLKWMRSKKTLGFFPPNNMQLELE